MPNLQDYQIAAAALLHDSNNLYTSLNTLNRYINGARRQLAKDTGCLRALVAGQSPFGIAAQAGTAIPGAAVPGQPPTNGFNTIGGVEQYSYQYANEYLQTQYAGYDKVIDIFGVAVSWGGAIRPVQNWMPWDELQAVARSYNVGVFSYPYVWSDTGTGENGKVWLWPAPSTVTEMEWDCFCIPKNLNTNDDPEPIPSTYVDAVAYYVARTAKMSSNQFAAADYYEQKYREKAQGDAGAASRARVPNYYSSVTDW